MSEKITATLIFMKLPEVKRITGLSRTAIYKLIQEGDFPKQVKLTERSVAWRSDQVSEWMQSKIEEGQ